MDANAAEAERVVKRWMWWSMGAALIPVPTLDMAAVIGLQLRMLSDLSKVYKVEFSENAGKSIVSALVGGVIPNSLALGPLGAVIKGVPVVGSIAGALTMPVFYGAATYAVGRVFSEHLASGGTFLDFDSHASNAKFTAEFERGKQEARGGMGKEPAPEESRSSGSREAN